METSVSTLSLSHDLPRHNIPPEGGSELQAWGIQSIWWPLVAGFSFSYLLINGDHVARMDHTGAVVDILNIFKYVLNNQWKTSQDLPGTRSPTPIPNLGGDGDGEAPTCRFFVVPSVLSGCEYKSGQQAEGQFWDHLIICWGSLLLQELINPKAMNVSTDPSP